MSNYIVSDSDLASVANAIRTKGGTSAQLAFPSGFVSAVQAIHTGGGSSVDSAFRVTDFKVSSTKWVMNQTIPNYVKTGGCIHIKYTRPTELISGGQEIISFGADALSASNSTTNCFIYMGQWLYGDVNDVRFNMRGSTVKGWLSLNQFADSNGEFEIKVYSDRILDVKTNQTYIYANQADGDEVHQWSVFRAAMSNFATYNYVSVGCNTTSTKATGRIISLVAIESE